MRRLEGSINSESPLWVKVQVAEGWFISRMGDIPLHLLSGARVRKVGSSYKDNDNENEAPTP